MVSRRQKWREKARREGGGDIDLLLLYRQDTIRLSYNEVRGSHSYSQDVSWQVVAENLAARFGLKEVIIA